MLFLKYIHLSVIAVIYCQLYKELHSSTQIKLVNQQEMDLRHLLTLNCAKTLNAHIQYSAREFKLSAKENTL